MKYDNKLLNDTFYLIFFYNTDREFRENQFKPALKMKGATFRGRPLKLYVKVLSYLLPEYKVYYQKIRQDQSQVEELLKRIYERDQENYKKLERASKDLEANVIPAELRQEWEKIDKVTDVTDRVKAYEKSLEKEERKASGRGTPIKATPIKISEGKASDQGGKVGVAIVERAVPTEADLEKQGFSKEQVEEFKRQTERPLAETAGIKEGSKETQAEKRDTSIGVVSPLGGRVPYPAKKILKDSYSLAGRGIRKLLTKALIPTITGMAGAAAGGIAGGVPGALGGAVFGVFMPYAISEISQPRRDSGEESPMPSIPSPRAFQGLRAGSFLGRRAATGALGRRLVLGTATRAALANPWVLGAVAAIALVLILFIFGFELLRTNSLFPPYKETLTTFTGGAGLSTDVGSCQFVRGDQRPPAASYKSQKLLGYFQEASAKSGVPAAILAAIARVESPGMVNFTDESLDTFRCPVSPTGARGLMQIQPPGTIGHNPTALSVGAQYLGVLENEIDLCNVRQNIFVGAAFVNSRRPGGRWDDTRTQDKLYVDGVAETYYGCLKYPSCSSGPYSYGDDLWNSLQTCQSAPGGSLAEKTTPPPVQSSKLRESILSEFNINMVGFNDNQLRWAWEKFWDVKHTNFNKLVRGPANTVTVQAIDGGSDQVHCSLVYLRRTINEPVLFKVVLTHELGHVIYWCNDDSKNRVTEHANIYRQEGAVTGYGEPVDGTACYGTLARTENYPEMITYYLNTGVVEQTGCNKRGVIPFANNKYPLHYNLAKKILGNY